VGAAVLAGEGLTVASEVLTLTTELLALTDMGARDRIRHEIHPIIHTEQVSMSEENQPEKKQKRKLPTWAYAAIGVPVVLIIGGVLWFFSPRIEDMFTPGPTLPPEAVAEGGVLYQTDFNETAVEEWAITNDGTLQTFISNGELVVDVNSFGDRAGFSDLNLSFTDFVLEVDARKVAGPDDNGILVIFRLQDLDNYYRFDISSDGFYSLSALIAGQPQTISEFHVEPSITADGVNKIRVEAVGTTFRFFVNGNQVPLCVNSDPAVFPLWENPLEAASNCLGGDLAMEWNNDAIASGRIALGAQGYVGFDGEQETPALATIAFDNLVITQP